MKLVGKIRTTGGVITVTVTDTVLETFTLKDVNDVPYVKGHVTFRSKTVGYFETLNGDIRVIGPITQMLKTGMDRISGEELGTDAIERTIDDLIALHIANIPCP